MIKFILCFDTPLTPFYLESRSPGLRSSISMYNSLKHSNDFANHLPMDWVLDNHYLSDGHHFSLELHHLLAVKLLRILEKTVSEYS